MTLTPSFLNPGHSHSWRDTSGSSPILVTGEHLERALELNGLLDGFTSLDLGIARWRRSKRATTIEDRLVETEDRVGVCSAS